MKFKDILEKHPHWGAEKSIPFLQIVHEQTVKKLIQERIEKEAQKLLKRRTSRVSPGLISGIRERELNQIRNSIKDEIEDAVYAERLEKVKKHPFYMCISQNICFNSAALYIQNSKKIKQSREKVEFYMILSVYLHLMDYIYKIKKQKAPQSLSISQIEEIIDASKILRERFEPCSLSIDYFKYQFIMHEILENLEKTFTEKIKKKNRAGETALQREFFTGLSQTLIHYLGDVPSGLVHILCGIIGYNIELSNVSAQIKILKKSFKEESLRFSLFKENICRAVLIDN